MKQKSYSTSKFVFLCHPLRTGAPSLLTTEETTLVVRPLIHFPSSSTPPSHINYYLLANNNNYYKLPSSLLWQPIIHPAMLSESRRKIPAPQPNSPSYLQKNALCHLHYSSLTVSQSLFPLPLPASLEHLEILALLIFWLFDCIASASSLPLTP